MSYLDKIDKSRLPKHVAIIMDGNGRWAKEQNKDRSYGHKVGVDTVHTVTEAATRLGLDYLTLYAFSTENWNRPEEEVSALMSLMVMAIEKETETLIKNNIRLLAIGDLSRLDPPVRSRLQKSIDITSENTGLTMVCALSYSSRWELTNVAKQLALEVKSGLLNIEDINEQAINDRLTTNNIPDPDLLIRTGGELRISNFLMWQLSYSELYFTEEYWPEFNEESLYKAIFDYQTRERRFGKTSEQL